MAFKSVYTQRHYEKIKNDPQAWAKEKARLRAISDSRKRFMDAVKSTIGCADCGTTEGRLDFDHRPGTVKLFNLAHGGSSSLKRLLGEMEKCDVRCVSCHGRRSAFERWNRR